MVDDPKDPRNRAERITALYNRARNGQMPDQTRSQQQVQGQGSQMVKDAAPGLHLRPKGPDRDAVDAEVHKERLASERQAKIEQLRKQAEEKVKGQDDKTREKDRSRDQDRDR